MHSGLTCVHGPGRKVFEVHAPERLAAFFKGYCERDFRADAPVAEGVARRARSRRMALGSH